MQPNTSLPIPGKQELLVHPSVMASDRRLGIDDKSFGVGRFWKYTPVPVPSFSITVSSVPAVVQIISEQSVKFFLAFC